MASSTTAAPAVSELTPQASSASPAVASNTPVHHNGSATPGVDGVIHPGLRMDVRTSNGAQRDGRVRNPIPSKLKGKTDDKKGNFNVMHMDISNTNESQARYDAAKRNSENTALQARLAETDHYVSHHRRANYSRTRTPGKESSTPAPPPLLPPPRTLALTPEETKAEQARLLTLLRTLPHANIVDQLCKALAFFGGIPDAPPPQDGKFPESGEANGPGSLFVGWISEIFPDLERPRRPTITLSAPPKRPRGRPKGSKATKARRDKGIKKGSKAGEGSSAAAASANQQNGDDEGWVDMDDSVVNMDDRDDTVEDRVLSLLATPPHAQSRAAPNATPATASTGFTSINPALAEPASASKRRGRPKGSKNRPKEQGMEEPLQHVQSTPIAAPTAAATLQPAASAAISGPVGPANSSKKASGARPKGGKKSKAGNDSTPQGSAAAQPNPLPAQTSTSYIPPPTLPLAATRPSVPINSQNPIVNGSGSKNKRTQLPTQTQSAAPAPQATQPLPQVKESTVSAKRKRQSNKSAAANGATAGANNTGGAASHGPPQALSTTPGLASSNIAQPQAQLAESHGRQSPVVAPPAKRPRKSNAAASKRQAATAGPAVAGSSLPVAIESSPVQQPAQQPPAAQHHKPAEGLAAHLDRFAALQNNNEHTQAYSSQHQAQPQPQQHASMSSSHSTAPAAEGLEAHYERFQNRQQSAQQGGTMRQQSRQNQPQGASVSPAPSQASKPQVTTLPSQQQTRQPSNTPNYYNQSPTGAYTVQQGSYTTNPRQSQSTSTSSPGTALVSHVTHSPQFGSQSTNSPLLSADNTFRGSPSMGFAPRRTPSASPMDNNYRASGVANQTSHFNNPRQTPTTAAHSGVSPGFQSFPDNGLFDLQGFDSTANHNTIGLGATGSYGMGPANVQRNNSTSNSASAYANASMANGAYDQGGLSKGTMNTGYRGQQARWS
ncbi:hypothetical protein JX266_012842 [Neoarthrinium moseri]|uniref:uncharacterized protein n=1 Tax=Neoarthrinium moseri TaxID=1658444 RepID=UPI001FDC0AD9|nr:uncharacterized protein JN550_006286 [Neoarthrinium moseri]KAI1840982.1 hypothetical protein JX266_012842 [Neoarthrinium moseri]KAI1868711.1 hypothetical protein JN550_006286 [Neoarthrinium moseri]